ncbi:RNA recognition motif domain-containing protein [Hirsutella rhossiliensis]|uniref:RNA recognition motif domain-containing protein n=1 Tax=Hirsutella rhossiliensis TaxID=111463 RepID=A0A9P8SLJ2_9HYPO|nr:RNA recognition motif domain-containing protein [Hirsutella rhossiliensis]KAH0965870.1 RNA recognition motif domain-containing protein [Hirsutella rhossiliensis]
MDASTGVATHYLPNPTGRNVHGHGPPHAVADPTSMMGHFTGLTIGGMGMPNNSGPLPLGPGHFMVGSDGQFVLAPMPAAQTMGMGHSQENPYHNFALPAGGYGPPYVGLPMPIMPFTPGRANANHARIERGNSEVPGLENRRGSYSTTESTPATPFYGTVSQRDGGPRVASLDRSAYTTPSPQQMGLATLHAEPAKSAVSTVSDRTIDEILKKEPAVPRAVPAVFTPPGQMKSLEQSLENRIPGNRNVYIRGLHPTTDDRLLYEFASRFGPVETSKAIIDTNTGACKGFGFAKFCESHDSELCIRGFHRLGYEVGFARESFNSRLKAEGDEASTNLYISNLPKSLTEVELATIFLGYTILSSKILRDSMGNSRGVGFARFESRDVCDEVIHKFNGVGIGEEGLLINIRYADTPAQKELKRVTAERRQFRTNEYNIGAYGTPLVGMSPTLYGQQSQWRRTLPASRSSVSTSSNDDGNATRHSGTRRGLSEAVTNASTDAAVSTPNSSECDEGVTIHADPTVVAAADESVQTSPRVHVAGKKETQ